jgi:prepilin-type processing-associated H-X9-DG protein
MKSHGVRCLDNLRQIMGALMMYTHDNHDLFPPNPDDGTTVLGHNWSPGLSGPGQPAEFNPDLIASRCLLMPYVNTNVSLLRCTADMRVGIYQGTDPSKIGTKVPAVRSISMSQAVGTICPSYDTGFGHSGKPTLSVNGRWLDGSFSHRLNSPYRTYGKLSEVVIPGPSRLWVITEEDPYSINDATIAHNVTTPEWIDFPSTLHGMSCVIGFADGHVEHHKWTDPRTAVVAGNVNRKSVPNSADWTWFSERTTARVQ